MNGTPQSVGNDGGRFMRVLLFRTDTSNLRVRGGHASLRAEWSCCRYREGQAADTSALTTLAQCMALSRLHTRETDDWGAGIAQGDVSE